MENLSELNEKRITTLDDIEKKYPFPLFPVQYTEEAQEEFDTHNQANGDDEVKQRIQDKKAARVAKIQEYRKSRLAKIQEYRESNKQLQVNTKPKVGFDWKKTLQDLKTSYDEGLITESDWEAAKSRILEKSF